MVGWEGITSWSDTKDLIQDKNIITFKRWVHTNLKYIRDEKARELLRRYYTEAEAGKLDRSKGEYVYLQKGKDALYAAYKKERDMRQPVSG